VINPETINVQKIKILRKLQPDAKFILYMWDSFKNKESSRNIVNFFDKKITFDKEDSKIYSMKFLPLFYIDLYEKISCKDSYRYDICFIGTAHSDRYEIVKKIEQLAKQSDLKMYSFFYLPSRIMYWVRKVFLRQYKYGNIKDFSLEMAEKFGGDAQNTMAKNLVQVDETQLYIGQPILYYAAEFNGLFSAQVVPNDEQVSAELGKKIFAYADFVMESKWLWLKVLS
jgi:hypothetical protein